MMNFESKFGFENPFLPDQLLINGLGLLEGGTEAIDIGCGEGADSYYLGSQGFNVLSIDKNQVHLNRLDNLIKDQSIGNIKTINHDVGLSEYHLSGRNGGRIISPDLRGIKKIL